MNQLFPNISFTSSILNPIFFNPKIFSDSQIWSKKVTLFGKTSTKRNFANTGPILIIFGALESYKFSLSSEFGLVSIQQKPILTLICLHVGPCLYVPKPLELESWSFLLLSFVNCCSKIGSKSSKVTAKELPFSVQDASRSEADIYRNLLIQWVHLS